MRKIILLGVVCSISMLASAQLLEIVSTNDNKAGTYEFIDKTAIGIIKRSNIKTVIVNGNNPENVKKAITEPIGTLIVNE
jgi:uridylate kinase